ncbi:hypothetical protein TKK_0001357 [Trichogramma kaykai]
MPTFKEIVDYLENRIHALEATSSTQLPSSQSKSFSKQKATKAGGQEGQRISTLSTTTRNPSKACPCSNGSHKLQRCPTFKALSPQRRLEYINLNKLCILCMMPGHRANNCKSSYRCKECEGKHIILLHDALCKSDSNHPRKEVSCNVTQTDSTSDSEDLQNVLHSYNAVCLPVKSSSCVLLTTARVRHVSPQGYSVVVRALLDSVSESSFITEKVAKKLQLRLSRVNDSVSGIRAISVGQAHIQSELQGSTIEDLSRNLNFTALVLDRITSDIPSAPVKPASTWSHLAGLKLADPDYGRPGPIDVMFGADVTGFLLLDQTRSGSIDEPVAKLSWFGWVLMGRTGQSASTASTQKIQVKGLHTCPNFVLDSFWKTNTDDVSPIKPANRQVFCSTLPQQVDTRHTCASCELQTFWEIEHQLSSPMLSEEDSKCEQHFKETHYRDATGRFVVSLPFKSDQLKQSLSENRLMVMKLYHVNEARTLKSPKIKGMYDDFMQEYLNLQHMRPSRSDTEGNYIPHHCIFKNVDSTPKIRVVFNASFKVKNGNSLNDCLLTGPKLQKDLWMILTSWRQFRVAFTADIIKMFRQIKINPADYTWQRIFWRDSPNEKLRSYELTTVTYGTAPAPYLALRVIQQLAKEEIGRFPEGAEIALRSSYMDDFYGGADTEKEAIAKRESLTMMLAAGGFELSKWASNNSQVCPTLSEEEKPLKINDSISTLGLRWYPHEDSFALKVTLAGQNSSITKRTVLSEITKLFDSMGWFAPVIVTAKIMIQDTWIQGLDWDQRFPPKLEEAWLSFRAMLPGLESIRVPRWIGQSSGGRLELHAFCDASERAYAAAVYAKVIMPDNTVTVHLLVAKTKVAPVKTLGIPRLELCGAALLAKLVASLQSELNTPIDATYAWCDSQVTLTWLYSHASRWSPFVANRVTQIQEILSPKHWRYVRSSQNLADLATRGISTNQLREAELWWRGPSWLHEVALPTFNGAAASSEEAFSEMKRKTVCATARLDNSDDLIERYSSYTRLTRVTAWIQRFIHNCKNKKMKRTSFLTAEELRYATETLIKRVQLTYLQVEFDHVKRKLQLPKKSPLRSLKPMVDNKGLLRVGGRLVNAPSLFYDEKHPIILPYESHLSTLLVRDAHHRTLHAGPQTTRNFLAARFWILRCKTLVHREMHNCIICTRYAGTKLGQIMGDLPPIRLTPVRPFLAAGVDYAGPIAIRASKGRGHSSYKGYICLFVCMSSKAIHLEAVSDLTAVAFVAAYKRFVSRRGICHTLISDNGTTFRGADKELKSMFRQALEFYQRSAARLANHGTDWTFIPPRAPHFGGIWEAGVRSVKHHLRRVIKDSTLTFEELSTMLCQIEACLNSRPLYQLSSSATDPTPITPGHILIGGPLLAVPEPGLEDVKLTPSARWNLLTQMRDQFWHRWRFEYLHTLQQHNKWRVQHDDLHVGSMVLISEDNSPPTHWPMGIIQRTYKGDDGLVRVAIIKTANSVIKRPIHKLCLLPIATE